MTQKNRTNVFPSIDLVLISVDVLHHSHTQRSRLNLLQHTWHRCIKKHEDRYVAVMEKHMRVALTRLHWRNTTGKMCDTNKEHTHRWPQHGCYVEQPCIVLRWDPSGPSVLNQGVINFQAAQALTCFTTWKVFEGGNCSVQFEYSKSVRGAWNKLNGGVVEKRLRTTEVDQLLKCMGEWMIAKD